MQKRCKLVCREVDSIMQEEASGEVGPRSVHRRGSDADESDSNHTSKVPQGTPTEEMSTASATTESSTSNSSSSGSSGSSGSDAATDRCGALWLRACRAARCCARCTVLRVMAVSLLVPWMRLAWYVTRLAAH